MGQYRKKPTIIEAEQWFPNKPVRGICRGECGSASIQGFVNGYIPAHVHTIHNNQAVALMPGDWVLPEPDGEHYYPVKPDIFAERYEPAAPAEIVGVPV